MGVFERIRFVRDGRLTRRACLAVALATAGIGLGGMVVIPVSPPDSAMSARVAAWRALTPPPRPATIR